jgi:hypothetical protein
MTQDAAQSHNTLSPELERGLMEIIESTRRRDKIEEQTLEELKSIRGMLMGTDQRAGLLHRVDQIEVFLGQAKRYSVVVIIALVGGQPIVDRVLPQQQDARVSDALLALADALAPHETEMSPRTPPFRPPLEP